MVFKKGQKSWNKGLTKETDERVRKLSNSQKGRTSPRKGCKLSKETKKKISSARLNTKHTEKTKLKMSISRKGRKAWNKDRHYSISKKYNQKENHPRWRDNISTTCITCNKKIIGKECFIKNRKFCSKKCQSKYYYIDFLNRRKKMIIPKQDTSIEIKIQNFLKQLNIEYFTHQYINIKHGYQCDVLIPSLNIVIECDGNYWHRYPTGNDIDHIRTSELIEKGFKVLRLWESEIKEMTLNKFKEKIL